MTDAETAGRHMSAGPSYWQRSRRLAWLLVALWSVLGLGLPLAVEPLNAVAVLGIPLGYYIGAQGALILAALVLLLLVRRQARIDRAHGLDD